MGAHEALKYQVRISHSSSEDGANIELKTQWQDTALHPAATAPTPFTFAPPVRSTASPRQVSEQRCGSSCSTERDTTFQYCLAGDTHGSIKEGRSIATRKSSGRQLRRKAPEAITASEYHSWRSKDSAM